MNVRVGGGGGGGRGLHKLILCYGCEVCGAKNYTRIKTFHIKFLKQVLHVKSTINTAMVQADWKISSLNSCQFVYR